jgi:hypothetical protein
MVSWAREHAFTSAPRSTSAAKSAPSSWVDREHFEGAIPAAIARRTSNTDEQSKCRPCWWWWRGGRFVVVRFRGGFKVTAAAAARKDERRVAEFIALREQYEEPYKRG